MDLFFQVLIRSHDRCLNRFFQIELKQVSLDFTLFSVRTTPLTASFCYFYQDWATSLNLYRSLIYTIDTETRISVGT